MRNDSSQQYVYSIVIPHKNNLSLLKRCVASIPKDRMDVQVIIVDDFSRESELPSKMQFDRPVDLFFLNEGESKGAGRARNVGLSHAEGKWVLFADCDDYYEPDFLSVLDRYVESNRDMIIFDAFWGKNLKTGTCWKSNLHKYIEEFEKNPKNVRNLIMMKHENNSCWNKMYSISYLKKIGAAFDETPSCNDAFFVQYASANTWNVDAVNLKLYCYLSNQQSITTTKQSINERMKKIKTVGRVHRYMQSVGAGIAIPSLKQGLKTSVRRYGILRTSVFILANLYYGVPIYKRFLNCAKKWI